MRHVLVHDSFDVDDAVVVDTVRVYLPGLAKELERVLHEDGETDDGKASVKRI